MRKRSDRPSPRDLLNTKARPLGEYFAPNSSALVFVTRCLPEPFAFIVNKSQFDTQRLKTILL
ncbi:MAG TPA: hypothetical protein VFD47_05885, partial [Actinomycetota bacterium]|nr:hypothetical protein [Actinomycetota bacterium]